MTTPDFAAIDRMLARLRGLKGLAKDSAPAIARACKEEIGSNVQAQQDPYHRPWRPGQDGHPILTGASKAVTVEAHGTVVQMAVEGVEALHHKGTARGYKGGAEAGRMPVDASKRGSRWKRKWFGGFRRNIIPPGGTIPGPMRTVIAVELSKKFKGMKK